eukprot:3630839-Prymnesium_polylepis.1
MADMADALDEGEIAYVLLRGEGAPVHVHTTARPLAPPSRLSSALLQAMRNSRRARWPDCRS